MKVSLSWLKELVDYDLTPKELSNKLSLTSIGVKDTTSDYLELDLTYNRGDLLSLRGVAREVSAITGAKIKFSDEKADLDKSISKLNVDVRDTEHCPVYCLAKIEGLKVDKSHDNWVKKLSDSGIRAVNNVADVTNLIMVEFGQPMHAFDARAVKDETIIVRAAEKGERITTLDGKTRDLDTDDLLIADPQNNLGIAGVMGGKDSEITGSTTTILLEAAIFDPTSNRAISKRHGLYSEASKRFQHGLTKTNLLQALSEAIKIYERLGGRLTALTLKGDFEDKTTTIELRHDYLERLLGLKINTDQVESLLKKLQFKVGKGERGWKVTPPYYRLDIKIEEDVIEEVARMYGYDKIPTVPLADNKPVKIDQALYQFVYKLKEACKEAGLTEVSTYSFYSTEVLKNMEIDEKLLLKVANPISSETEYLRFTIWENLLEAASKNVKKGHKDIAIFEVGKAYHPKKGDLPEEGYELAMLLLNGSDNPLLELHEILQKVLKKVGFEIGVTEIKNDPFAKKLFHPQRARFITLNNKPVGGLVEVHPRIVNRFGIDKRVAVVELNLTKIQ